MVASGRAELCADRSVRHLCWCCCETQTRTSFSHILPLLQLCQCACLDIGGENRRKADVTNLGDDSIAVGVHNVDRCRTDVVMSHVQARTGSAPLALNKPS